MLRDCELAMAGLNVRGILRAPNSGLQHGTMSEKSAQAVSGNVGKGLCSFRLGNIANSHRFSANPRDAACPHWNFTNLSAPAAGRSKPLPYGHAGRLCVFNQCLRGCELAMAGLNIRGILTPACAPAQNDSSIRGFPRQCVGRRNRKRWGRSRSPPPHRKIYLPR